MHKCDLSTHNMARFVTAADVDLHFGDGTDLMCEACKDTAYILNGIPMLWDWLATFEPGERGFMFSNDPLLVRIREMTDHQGHSAASFAVMMRLIAKIARA